MNPELIELLTQQWKDICAKYSTSELNDTFEFVKANSSDLVSEFYTQMMKEEHALEFLVSGDCPFKITANAGSMDFR